MLHRARLVTCGLGLLLAAPACEGESSDSRADGGASAGAPSVGSPFEQFVGRWEYTGGTSTLACPNGSDTSPLKGWMELFPGVDSALVAFDGPCALRLDVKGNTATIRAGQTCEDEDESPTAGVIKIKNSYSSLTFTITGIMATESTSIAEVLSASKPPGTTISCTTTRTGTLRKVTK